MATYASSHADVRVLVVDDNSDTLDLDEMLFRSRGADVRVARDGHTALGLTDAWLPSILVTELYLPDMSSFALIVTLRSRIPPGSVLKVIIATSRARLQDRLRASEAGFDAFFPKPVDLDALLRAAGMPLSPFRVG
jgi:DNA-binding response OmpR family regulator